MQSIAAGRHSSSTRGCTEFASLYQHPLLENPPSTSAPADLRRRHLMMSRKVEDLCLDCPLMAQCLYDAVVKYDVTGFVGATTARQRHEIRARLRISLRPEDFDSLAGVTGGNRQIDHDEVIRLRAANPHESLDTLAGRLGCSLSTVKRHLRRHREEGRSGRVRRATQTPSGDDVLAAYRQVTAPPGERAEAA